MENQKNEIPGPFSVWRCIYPILIYIGAQMVAVFGVTMAYSVSWLQRTNIDITAISQEEFVNRLYEYIFEQYAQINYVALITAAVLAIPLFLWLYRSDERKRRETEQEKVSGRVPPVYYSFLLLIAVTYSLAASNMVEMSGLMEMSGGYQAAEELLTGHGLWMGILGVGLAAPITEELLFRGLVFGRMRASQPLIGAMIFSSLLFALMHGNLVQGAVGFFMGLLYCYVCYRYRTLWASILLHVVNNMLSVLSSETEVLGFLNVFYDGSVKFMVFTFVLCLGLVAGVYLIERYVRPCFTPGDAPAGE